MISWCKYRESGYNCQFGCTENEIFCHKFARGQCHRGDQSHCKHGRHHHFAEAPRQGSSSSSTDRPTNRDRDQTQPPRPGTQPDMNHLAEMIQIKMTEHYNAQSSNEAKKKARNAFLKNFHPDKWASSSADMDALARRLTTWINNTLNSTN